MKLTLVDGDDWQGFYVDGKLQIEGHSVRLVDALEKIGMECEVVYPDMDWLVDNGNMPENIEDVVIE